MAVVQMLLALPVLLLGRDAGAPVHIAREVGSFDFALAVGFLFVGWRPARAYGMLPLVAALVACLGITTAVDLARGTASFLGESAHLLDLFGLASVWEPGSSALPWWGLALILAALVVVIGQSAAWAPGLAAVTAVLVAVDVFHNLGLGLANAGGLGYRLGKAITQSPFSLLGWVAGALAIVWLLRRRSDGLTAAGPVGVLIFFLGGVGDATALSRSEVPFGFGAGLARLAVAASIGLGFGLAVATAVRLAGVGGPAPSRAAARDRPATTPAET